MPFQRTSLRTRFSNRQAIVFIVTIAIGALAGAAFGRTSDGLMIGAVVGALLMIAPAIRDRPESPD